MPKYSPEVLEALKKTAVEVEESALQDTKIKRTSATDFDKVGSLTPDVASRRSYKPEELQEIAVEAERRKGVITEKRVKKSAEINKALTSEQRRDLDTLVIYGRANQTEFPKVTLDSWGIDEPTQTAYYQYIDDSRYAHGSANALEYRTLEKGGWQSSSVTGDIIKEVDKGQINTQQFSKMAILDTDTGDLLSYRNSSIEDLNEKFFSKGYKLYRVFPDQNKDYTHYFSKNPEEIAPLPQFVLPYVKGGSNAYTKDTHFAKIGRDFYDKEGGRLFHGYAKTLKADTDVKRLEKYVEEVNQVSDMWKRTEGDLAALQRELDQANFQEFKVTSAVDVKDMIHSKENPGGVIDPNYKAQVLRNNERYVYADQGAMVEQLDDFDLEASNLMQIQGTYYRSRGEKILENLNNDFGHVMDPFTMQQRNIEQAAYNNTLGRFFQDYGDWFKEQYAPVIDSKLGKYNISRMSGEQVLASADIKAPNSNFDELARSARRAQLFYQNLVNTPTKLDVYLSTKMTDMLHKLPKRFWDNKYMDSLLNSDIISWANALVYRTYLGFFNAKQFVLQGPLQMFNILAFAPVKGTQALVSLPAVLLGHFFKDTPIMNYIPKLLAGMGGISPKEYEGFMKFIDDYGTFKQFSKRPELVENMENWLKTHSQIDLIFAQAGNNLSQLHADLTAFLIDGGKNMRNICRMSDDFMLNLNRANTSMVQRTSIGKIAAQFTSYPLAAYEIMTGNHLSGWQRARFMALQLGLWGIGGTFAKDYVTNLYDFARQKLPEADPQILSYALEGIGTQFFAERGTYISEGVDFVGTIQQMLALVPVMGDLFGSAPELPASNVPTIIVDNYNSVRNLIVPKTGVYDLMNWARTTSQKKGTPSGVKNVLKYIYSQDARQFIDRNGDVLRRNPEEFAKWVQLLGFGNIESVMDYRSVKRDNIAREAVRAHFESNVLPFIKDCIDFRKTPHSYGTEMARTSERSLLQGNAEAATREAYAWVREFRPQYERYLTSLIERAWGRGDYKEYSRSEAQQEFYKEQEKIYNQE